MLLSPKYPSNTKMATKINTIFSLLWHMEQQNSLHQNMEHMRDAMARLT